MTKTRGEKATQQLHAIAFTQSITQSIMHVKYAEPLCCQGDKAKINNIREY